MRAIFTLDFDALQGVDAVVFKSFLLACRDAGSLVGVGHNGLLLQMNQSKQNQLKQSLKRMRMRINLIMMEKMEILKQQLHMKRIQMVLMILKVNGMEMPFEQQALKLIPLTLLPSLLLILNVLSSEKEADGT